MLEMMWLIEHEEAKANKAHQENLRESSAKEFIEALERGLPQGAKLGRVYFTPSSYQVNYKKYNFSNEI